jgi:sulfatase modifying factor 1
MRRGWFVLGGCLMFLGSCFDFEGYKPTVHEAAGAAGSAASGGSPGEGICGTRFRTPSEATNACLGTFCCAEVTACDADQQCFDCMTGAGNACDTNALVVNWTSCEARNCTGLGGTGSGPGTGGTGGATGGTGGAACPLSCGALEECYANERCVAKSVSVAGGYEIDSTEVTRSQYQAWLATSPSTGGQSSPCSWNDSYTPSCEWPAGTKGNHPVVCVDWCDAYAYCKAAGKRLCGKIGGGANAYDQYANASLSQWYKVCTSNGQNDYPYGDTYSGTTCNGDDAGNGTTVPVGSMSGCQSSVSGYKGVFDLSGNVWEWEDSCNGNSGTSDHCHVRGGSFYYDGVAYDGDLPCVVDGSVVDRDYDVVVIGFRCCSSP